MNKNIILMIIGLIIIGTVYAQKPFSQNPELRNELQQYIEKNIVPVLQKKQAEFDAKLNAADQTFIKAERMEAKAKRAQHHAERKARHEEFKKQNPDFEEKRKAKREEWKNMTEEERKAKKEEWKNMSEEERQAKRKEQKEMHGKHRKSHSPELRAERKAKMVEVKAFMTRNQDLVKATMEDLKPLYQKWTTDQLAIIKKYHPEKAERLAAKEGHLPTGLFGLTPKRHHKRMHKGHRGEKDLQKEKREGAEKSKRHGGKKGMKGKRRLPVEFVLWDGSMPMEATPRTNEPNLSNNIKTSEFTLGQNFPNPAISVTQIQLDLPTEMANLDLTVTDIQGKIVKRISLTDLNAGNQMVELNVSGLPNGQYFYSIEGKDIKATKKMTVNH